MKFRNRVNLNVRATPEEYARWWDAAKRDSRSLSSWVRLVLERAAAETAALRKGSIQ